jgi:hypothetical protein
MALGQNPFNPSRTLPTLAAVQHRRRELLAYQARQEAAQALATPNELHTEEETPVPEEFHFTQEQEEQQENDCHVEAALAVWDYCRASARLLFDTAPIDPTAQRISQALDVTPEGLSRVQIRGLFHRHVSKDLALEQLLKPGLINRGTAAGRRRSASLWTKAQKPETGTNTAETDPYGA